MARFQGHEPGVRVAAVKDSKRNSPDRDRINVNEDYELRDWAKKFGVSPDELKRAVQQIGDRADAVRRHLGK